MAGAMPFGLKIAIINRAFRKRLDDKAAAMGLTAVQLRVLGSISRLEASGRAEIHQNDLEQIERVSHPAMTKLLQRLESKGFVTCETSAMDRRYKKVACTEKSAGIHNLILAQDAEVFDELCRDLTDAQRVSLLQMADLILKHIESD